MALVPTSVADKLKFYDAHNTPWNTNAVAIGVTTAIVTDLATKVATVKAAVAAQTAAQDAAKNATVALKQAVEAMDLAGGGIISTIRAKAKIAGPSVYTLAVIPPPATPSPASLPGAITKVAATLDANGVLTLKWKASNDGGGVIYQVFRRDAPAGEFVYLGGVGEKKYVDASIPHGASQLTYQIQGVRPTGAGPWTQYNVNFSAGAIVGREMTQQPVKIAA